LLLVLLQVPSPSLTANPSMPIVCLEAGGHLVQQCSPAADASTIPEVLTDVVAAAPASL
jgi:hypothetical protein